MHASLRCLLVVCALTALFSSAAFHPAQAQATTTVAPTAANNFSAPDLLLDVSRSGDLEADRKR